MSHSKMFKKLSVILLCSTLWACGGGGSDGDESGGGTGGGTGEETDVLSGIFLDSAVEGLHYETATQSGLTDSAGQFKYKQGEAVTFSIGGIALGTATGARQVTPFDLFTLTPPTTEAEVRAILGNLSSVDDYDRVLNMIVFLISLDNDGNPDNGLDLSGWHATLSAASLSFDVNKNNFSDKQFNDFVKRFGVTKTKSLATAFIHVIRSLNINIPVSLVSKQEVDSDNDGTVDRLTRYSYNAEGRQTASEVDSDNDGNVERTYTSVFTNEGFIAQLKIEFDNDGSEGLDVTNSDITNYTYNAQGKTLTDIKSTDNNGDGVTNERITITTTYDENDNQILLRTVRAQIDPVLGEVVKSITTETATFDTENRRLSQRVDVDSNADDVVDSIYSYTYSYNDKGEKTSEVISLDFGADGTLESLTTYTFSYDQNGNKLTELEEADNTSVHDGLDDIRSSVFTYNENNQEITKSKERSFYRIDINSPHIKETYTTTYNVLGQKESYLHETDEDNDGSINSTRLTKYEYDLQERRIKLTVIDDDDLLVVGYNSKRVTARTFSTNGLLTDLFEWDKNGNETLDYIQLKTNTYDSDGRHLTNLYEKDNDADGVFESGKKTTFSYTSISGGLLGLVLTNGVATTSRF